MTKSEKIARAVKYTAFARKNPNDVASVNFYLAAGDKITQTQLDAYHAAAKGAAPSMMVNTTNVADNFTKRPVSRATITEAEVSASPASTPNISQTSKPPSVSIAAAQQRLVESQVAFRTASQRVRECRGALGAALAKWQQAIGDVVTPEMNARQFIATEMALRQARRDGTTPPPGVRRHYRSAIDAAAAAAMNSGPGRAGGGNSFRRPVKLANGAWVRPTGIHDIGRR